MKRKDDWTVDPKTRRSNSSRAFEALVGEVRAIILGSGAALVAGNADGVARLILAQLAHKHGMVPGRLLEEEKGIA